jgi:thiomorpholine-carboxylate dehydrogenase
MRTAAVSAVALDALASPHVRTLGILGSGVQARSHIEAFLHVRPSLTEIRIWSRTPANAERLAAEWNARNPQSAHAVSIEEAAGSDVVLTVTSSTAPLLQGRWLAPHAIVLSVGATGATVRELNDDVMHSCFLVAESKSCAERESGDVILSGSTVQAEIGQILCGAVAPPTGRILFKSVGMAIEDLAAARLVWAARSTATDPGLLQ